MEVLVTNDDGYASPGLHAVADALADHVSVTVLAPAEDQSAVGRRRSAQVQIEERANGYVIDGTPADCVIVGLEALDLSPDLVVAGCNVGGNLGAYVLGRSGTISAAVEAAFFDVPAIALSLYVPDDQWPLEAAPSHFAETTRAARYLVRRTMETDVFAGNGYLNVNVPLDGEIPTPMRITHPSTQHALTAERRAGRIDIEDRTWRQMADGEWTEDTATDRGAVMRGCISVSPLTAPHQVTDTTAITDLIEAYEARVQRD